MLEDLFYTKQVPGQYGEPIRIFKLRTMQRNADGCLDELLSKKGFDNMGKITDDPRVTNLGVFLRKYWIDELPQVVNLVRGDIKPVGIRPKTDRVWEECPVEHKRRALQHKPGWMGVHYAFIGRSFDDVIKTEQQYLDEKEQHPFLTDVKYFFIILYNVFFKGLRSK